MRIKNFKKYCESISGTEMIGSMGPGYGNQILPVTMTSSDTQVIMSEIDSNLYTKDDYDNLYQDYLKKRGTPLDGFNQKNLDEVIDYLKKAI